MGLLERLELPDTVLPPLLPAMRNMKVIEQ